jgi:oxygen-independent coproporphyrinogen-3 oxidase
LNKFVFEQVLLLIFLSRFTLSLLPDTWDSVNVVKRTIEELKDKRFTNKVLHSHPSPIFWNDPITIDSVIKARQQKDVQVNKMLNLYVSLPFCLKTNPPNCGYCLFPHVDYSRIADIKNYLKYLHKEGQIYNEHLNNDDLAAIYFGGGTPNLLPGYLYNGLVAEIKSIFPRIRDNIEITFEGIPALFDHKKLVELKTNGITRISIGIQQLNPALIKMSGRKQQPHQIFQVIRWCNDLQLEVNVDLIYGWPKQTINTMLDDLGKIVQTGVNHITHYELNLGGRSDFSKNRRDELPSPSENLQLFLAAKEYLEGAGYELVSTYDYIKKDNSYEGFFEFEHNMRHGLGFDSSVTGYDMWGWGFGGISYFIGTPDQPGCVFMNTTNLDEYYHMIDNNQPPIKRGYQYLKDDIRIGWLFQCLQNLYVNLYDYQNLFGSNLYTDFDVLWDALLDLGWIKLANDKLSLIKEGIYYTPLIQNMLATRRNNELRH